MLIVNCQKIVIKLFVQINKLYNFLLTFLIYKRNKKEEDEHSHNDNLTTILIITIVHTIRSIKSQSLPRNK